jgi:hypothetical protein
MPAQAIARLPPAVAGVIGIAVSSGETIHFRVTGVTAKYNENNMLTPCFAMARFQGAPCEAGHRKFDRHQIHLSPSP